MIKKKITKMKKTIIFSLITLIAIGCTEQEKSLTLSPSQVTLHHDEQQYVHIIGEPTGAEWTSENEFVAKVDNGTIKGNHVGKTIIHAKLGNKRGTCAVDVKPKHFTYIEPIMNWGMSKSNLKSIKGTPWKISNDGNILYYQQDAQKIIECYSFENDLLRGSAVILAYTLATSAPDFINERYQQYSYETDGDGNYIFYYANALTPETATLSILSSLNTSTLVTTIIYTEYEHSSSVPERIKKQFIKKI